MVEQEMGTTGGGAETPIQEESIETLTTKLDQVSKELEQTKKGLSTAHQTINKKEQELKRQTGLEGRLDTLEKYLKVAFDELTTKGKTTEDEELEETPKVKSRVDFAKNFEEDQLKTKRKGTLDQKLSDIQSRTEVLGFNEEDPEYHEIKYASYEGYGFGDFGKAEALLKKYEKAKAKTQEKPEEPVDTEKKARELLKEKVNIPRDIGSPGRSGKVFTREQIPNMSPEEYAKERENIMQALKEGRLK